MRGAPALVAAALAVLLALPLVAQAGSIAFTSETYKIPIYEVVYNATVSVSANSSSTITLTLPSGWSWSHVEAVILRATDASGSIELTAKDSNGTSVASATIVPLSSGYQVTLPASTRTIELFNSGSTVWNGSIVIYVQSTVEFRVTGVPTTLTLQAGGSTGFQALVEQISGPPGQVWWASSVHKAGSVSNDLLVTIRWQSTGQTGTVLTSGAGWSDYALFNIDAEITANGQYTLDLKLYYGDQTGSNTIIVAAITGTVDLTGPTSASVNNTKTGLFNWSSLDDRTKYALIGFGAIFILVILLMAMGVIGRRGMASIGGGMAVALLLVFAAVLAIGLTVIDPEKAMAVGIGVGVTLVLLLLIAFGKLRVTWGG